MMGSNIALGFEGDEVSQLARHIRRLPSPSIFFIIVRDDSVCACDRMWVDVENVSWKKGTYMVAEGSSPRTVSSDAISRLTARIKWKTFRSVREVCVCVCVRTYFHTRVHALWYACSSYMSNLYSHYEKSRHKVSPSFISSLFLIKKFLLTIYWKNIT